MREKIFTLLLLLPLKGLFAQFYVGSGVPMSITAGSTLYSAGDFIVAAGGMLNNAGTLEMGGGDLDCEGTVTAMKGLVFSGTSAQQYLGQPLQADTLTVANAAGLTLAAPVTVSTSTAFASGLIATSDASPLIYAAGALPGTPNDGSHVNGPVQYNGTGSFAYPVGSTSYYRSVGVNLSSNSSGMTAAYFASGAPAGALTAPLQAVSGFEYWTLTPVSTANGTVRLNWDASKVSTGILSPAGVAALQVAHLSGGSWVSEGGAATGTEVAGSVTSGNTVSAWSPFALGSTNASIAPLPLTFLDISAALLADGSRKVDWRTAAERQLKNYTVERSPDGRQFAGVGEVAATGAGSYSYIDAQAAGGKILYYRVRGNDLDAQPTYSRTVAVQLGRAGAGISIVPNPVKDQLTIIFSAGMGGRYAMDLLGVDGRIVYHADLRASDEQGLMLARPAGLAAGVYLARLVDENGKAFTYRLIFE
jgi:hypothetical protein